jgi:hypothetical protein
VPDVLITLVVVKLGCSRLHCSIAWSCRGRVDLEFCGVTVVSRTRGNSKVLAGLSVAIKKGPEVSGMDQSDSECHGPQAALQS